MQADLACLIGKIVTFTTHLYEDGECAKFIGTGFALREGLVITARHVLYSDQIQVDSTKPRKIYWLGGSAEGELVTEIVFEHAEWDIAVLACPTPAIKTSALLMSKPAKSSTPWESIGYLAAGMNREGIRIETAASGTCVSYVPSTDSAVKHIQHLYPRDKLKTAEWQGMSGAPVFVEETAQLIGILIRTADALPDRLVMLSLAYVLKNNEAFKHLVQPHQSSQLVPKVIESVVFKERLIANIEDLLRSESNDVLIWCEHLAEKLKVEDARDINALAKHLVNLKPDQAINALTIATGHCVASRGRRRSQILDNSMLKEISQQLLGWLVLNSVDDKYLPEISPHCIEHDSLFFTLAVKSLTGVEVAIARRFNRSSDFKAEIGSEQKSRSILEYPISHLKWNEQESARKLFIEVWNQVFPSEKLDKNYTPKAEAWERLNDELLLKRENEIRPVHYYLPLNSAAYPYEALAEYAEAVYHHFLSQLKQLTIVQYGVTGQANSLFVISETALQAQINNFFYTIEVDKDKPL